MSVTTSIGRPRSASVCQGGCELARDRFSTRSCRARRVSVPDRSRVTLQLLARAGARCSPEKGTAARSRSISAMLRPHPAPAKDVAVHDVVGLIIVRRPASIAVQMHMIGEELASVRHVGEAVPLLGGARETRKGRPVSLQIVANDRERRCPCSSRGRALSPIIGVGAVHRSTSKSVSLRRRRRARPPARSRSSRASSRSCVFAERRRRERALAVGLERSEVMLEARDERDVPDAAGGTQRIEDVPHHAGVDADVLGFRRSARPRREKDGVRCDVCERGRRRPRVGQVGRQRRDPGLNRRSAREAVHRPAFLDEQRRRGPPRDPARSDHQRRVAPSVPPFVPDSRTSPRGTNTIAFARVPATRTGSVAQRISSFRFFIIRWITETVPGLTLSATRSGTVQTMVIDGGVTIAGR